MFMSIRFCSTGILQNLLGVFVEAQVEDKSIGVSLCGREIMVTVHFDAPLFPLIIRIRLWEVTVKADRLSAAFTGAMLSKLRRFGSGVLQGTVEMEPTDDGMYRIRSDTADSVVPQELRHQYVRQPVGEIFEVRFNALGVQLCSDFYDLPYAVFLTAHIRVRRVPNIEKDASTLP